MLPYTEQVLRKECNDCVEQFTLIQEAIGEASFEQVKELSCHDRCMAVGESFGLKVEHGYYMPGFEHSWCVDRCGNIIDVYPCGVIGGPILIAKIVAYCMRLNGLYEVNDNPAVLKECQTITEECGDCVEQFALIRKVINKASFGQVEKLSCHVLCMAVGELFGLKVKHGYYMPGFEHSWCVDRCGNIIDVYPWGVIGGPVLIAKTVANRLRLNGLYRVNNNLEVLKERQTSEDADTAKAEIAQLLELYKAT